MAKHNTGTKNGMWKGGRTIASNGYVLVRVGKRHHLADSRGYAYEHRVIAEHMIGRRLRHGEIVHHKNEKKTDNRPSNLKVEASIGHHLHEHRKPESQLQVIGEANPVVACECGCGETFRRYDNLKRPRRFVSGHNGRIRG